MRFQLFTILAIAAASVPQAAFGLPIDSSVDLYVRDNDVILAREPIFGKIFKVGKKLLGFKRGELEDLASRDFEDDLFAREFEDDILARDFEDMLYSREENELLARDPLFGKIFKVGKKLLGFKRDELEARDFEGDVYARDFDDMLYSREENELLARDPLFGKIFKVGKKLLGFKRDELEAREFEDDLYAREYDDIVARDYEDALEMFA
ncbi:hypothetical protein NLI96_g3069 [Meripilus lineatus]|uniref:Uncharacterized protein n=1 Tax=Meripilus lineatus TaxID=2056292 RepID=A0AAD5V9H6_9APHY|nr:hypothetical protein NLI96_g3069 [Physisporinus lineatus]